MKHPDCNIESFEFNLGKAPDLRCVQKQNTTFCGSCESCLLTENVNRVKSWFSRAGDQSQRRFTLGLVRRLHSVDLIQYFTNLLQPLLCKDFMYARMRTTPSLATDRATMSCDRALSAIELEKNIAETWFWFQQANYWTKSNFLLIILQWCDAHLLHAIGTQARTQLVSEQQAFAPKDEYEAASVASSSYSFESKDHPELDFLSTVCSDYESIEQNPFTPNSNTSVTPATPTKNKKPRFKIEANYDDEIINEDSDEESFGGSPEDVDPTCLVIPGSAKAYAGVARHKDFIRSLPVHLSKYILGFLDQVSLFNCVCVSRHWRLMSEEAHKEFYVNQQVREEVMLMQGAAAQGCNPVYANDVDVAVPNIAHGSWEAIKTDENVIETTFKSEVSFRTAYSGYSTRNIIMEERNVYCGAYNVMVLTDQPDPSRVSDTDGSHLIAVGSQDRKVRFLNTETAQEEPPVVSGHAGSVRCVALCHKGGYVLSGSYDTSIRKWSLETGKCQKIFRGHRDTVQCLKICNDKIVSGGKDHMCKVWLIETGKCVRTFKHRHAITAVAMGEDPLPEIVISGCERGRVKVWDLKTGNLIKRLSGHHAPVTDIKFDIWHIITASADGYALTWSSQGNHSRCLTALRHPKEVLSLEFMYLRVITGSADGKLRIWNIINGQCLRIMRGNSRSDPIIQLTAIGNTITINTSHNLLVLNFETVEFDYTLENDKMPPLVQYSKYSDAPVRPQPYPYVRAQRMRTAGAANQKIIYHDNKQQVPDAYYQNLKRPIQTPHSAKTLSRQSMEQARRIQSACGRLENSKNFQGDVGKRSAAASRASSRAPEESHVKKSLSGHSLKSVSVERPGGPHKQKSRPVSSKSGSHSVTSGVAFQVGRPDDDSDITETENVDFHRRVSWAFENPLISKTKDLSLPETKSLLRSQMRAKGEVVPPDFIYLTINAIHSNMKPTEASKNMEMNRREQELLQAQRFGRPSSSPGRMDPRTKVPIEDLKLEQLFMEHGLAPRDVDVKSEAESKLSYGSKSSKNKGGADGVAAPSTTRIITEFAPRPIDSKPSLSLHSSKLKSSIPKAKLLRPHTATVVRVASPGHRGSQDDHRPRSAAIGKSRPGTAQTNNTAVKSCASDTAVDKSGHSKGMTSSGMTASHVPMMMYSKDMKEKLDVIREHRAVQQAEAHDAIVRARVGNVSQHNDPMRNHARFNLFTFEQVEQRRGEILDSYQQGDRIRKEEQERRQKQAWLAKVKGLTNKNSAVKKPVTRLAAPEIKEYLELEGVH